MDVVITKNDNVVIALAETTEIVENGILINGETNNKYILGNSVLFTVHENVEIPGGIAPQAYKYTVEGGFIKNPDYVEYIPIEKKVERLEAENIALKNDLSSAVMELSILIATGGV